jgi:hypothetical protein
MYTTTNNPQDGDGMSDTLIGVIIGGIIASVTPIITLFINNWRWRYEKKLERLKEERQRLEKKFEEILGKIVKGMTEDKFPIEMVSEMMVLMPKDVFDKFENWIKEEDKTPEKAKFLIMEISVAMKKHLAWIDNQIEDLVTVRTRTKTIRKKLKISLIILLIILIGVCGVLLNNYLSNNNLFFYAKGTKDKAFLNSTWKMTPKEIERANNTFLSETTNVFSLLFAPEITNKKRFKELVQEDLYLWGEKAKVKYEFFDNMLYEYYVSLTAYNLEKTHKEIFQTLRTKFGTNKEIKDKREDLIYYFEWESDKQKVSYWIGKNKEKDSYYVGIKALYQPFYRQIEELVKKEKQEYF